MDKDNYNRGQGILATTCFCAGSAQTSEVMFLGVFIPGMLCFAV